MDMGQAVWRPLGPFVVHVRRGDLPVLIRRAELAAHKLYLDTEPAAFFCHYECIRLRAVDDAQRRFRGEVYARLPHVQLHNGVRIEDVRAIFP
ncbi:CBN-GLY-1 protein [Aphelenchoides avenae]|nr:CBN-GLY-1 protein [Aphelenchus avenae]